MATKSVIPEVLSLKPSSSLLPATKQTIERYSCKEMSYNDFYWNYMTTNWPVILTDVSNNWNCSNNWLTNTVNNNENASDSAINFNFLRNKIGNCQVPVADCRRSYYNSHERKEMSFYDFLDYWQGRRREQDENDENSNISYLQSTSEDLFYLKDWHLKAQMEDYEFYRVPEHFASDWLNEYLLGTSKDDYRFVYMGPKDTW